MSTDTDLPSPAGGVALLELDAVLQKTTLRRSYLYSLIRRGEFPAPHKIGQLARWRSDEIDDWIEQVAPRKEVA